MDGQRQTLDGTLTISLTQLRAGLNGEGWWLKGPFANSNDRLGQLINDEDKHSLGFVFFGFTSWSYHYLVSPQIGYTTNCFF